MGFVALHRGALDSSLWQLKGDHFKVALTALLWANWSDGTWFDGRGLLVIHRGELVTSMLALGSASGVTERIARRAVDNMIAMDFIKKLSKRSDAYTLLRVINYDRYQDVQTSAVGARSERGRSAVGARSERGRQGNQRTKEPKNQRTNSLDFLALYSRYPRKAGKAKGIEKLKRMIRTPEAFAEVEVAVDRMAAAWAGRDTKFCPMFSTFVNQKRWTDAELPFPRGVDADDLSSKDIAGLADELEGRGE